MTAILFYDCHSMTAITTLAHVEESVIEDNVFIRLEILPADENRRLCI